MAKAIRHSGVMSVASYIIADQHWPLFSQLFLSFFWRKIVFYFLFYEYPFVTACDCVARGLALVADVRIKRTSVVNCIKQNVK